MVRILKVLVLLVNPNPNAPRLLDTCIICILQINSAMPCYANHLTSWHCALPVCWLNGLTLKPKPRFTLGTPGIHETALGSKCCLAMWKNAGLQPLPFILRCIPSTPQQHKVPHHGKEDKFVDRQRGSVPCNNELLIPWCYLWIYNGLNWPYHSYRLQAVLKPHRDQVWSTTTWPWPSTPRQSVPRCGYVRILQPWRLFQRFKGGARNCREAERRSSASRPQQWRRTKRWKDSGDSASHFTIISVVNFFFTLAFTKSDTILLSSPGLALNIKYHYNYNGAKAANLPQIVSQYTASLLGTNCSVQVKLQGTDRIRGKLFGRKETPNFSLWIRKYFQTSSKHIAV